MTGTQKKLWKTVRWVRKGWHGITQAAPSSRAGWSREVFLWLTDQSSLSTVTSFGSRPKEWDHKLLRWDSNQGGGGCSHSVWRVPRQIRFHNKEEQSGCWLRGTNWKLVQPITISWPSHTVLTYWSGHHIIHQGPQAPPVYCSVVTRPGQDLWSPGREEETHTHTQTWKF